MESTNLTCPLCCNETFDCKQSLKYHLLSIIDNIICPICNGRFESIFELANHYDTNCEGDKNAANSNCHFVQVKTEIHEVEADEEIEPEEELEAIEHGEEMEPNEEIDNEEIEREEKIIPSDEIEETMHDSILAKALLSSKSKEAQPKMEVTNGSDELSVILDTNIDNTFSNEESNLVELKDENVSADSKEDDVYSCSSCGISFTSVLEHIEQYHDGQEIVLEMFENEQEGSEVLTELPEGASIINEDSTLKEYINVYKDDEGSNESQDASDNKNVRMPQMLNTLKQEDCVDKDGRLYTRKVVQIEKFWNDEESKSRTPIVLKYIVNSDGDVTKLKSPLQEVPEGLQTIEIFQCSCCNVQFSKRKQYDVHVCDPEIASEYKCSMCNAWFTSSQSLCAHMKIHKSVKKEQAFFDSASKGPFICNVCDTVFPSNKSLRLHRRMHDPIKSKLVDSPVEYGLTGEDGENSKPREMFQCTVCNKFYDKSYEAVHMAYHSGVNHYDCQICNRKFYTKGNLEMHMRVHGTEKGHICSQCKKGFLTEESLQQHLKQHCTDRPYQCSYCSRRFARPHEKVKHERIHTGEKPHECEICGKTFRVSYCLTLHMRTHSGYRPYVCQHCGKRFKAHSVYNHHLLTHSDVRGYKCPYCPKAFKTGVQLAGHKNSHTKPFSCTQCNRPFASLYAVRAHMETHKRENNLKYNCYLCGASYARAFALRDHIKEQHLDATQNGNITLDIIEEGMEASSSILPESEDMNMVTTLEEISNVPMEEETVNE